MLHAKKMILVPHESIEKMGNENPLAPAPVGSYLQMDNEMHSIINDKSLDELGKYLKYEQILQRYMSKMNRTRKDVEFFVGEEKEEAGAEEEIDRVVGGPEIKKSMKNTQKPAHILEYKSASKNVKARLLFNLINKTNSVDVDEDGGLHVDGAVIGDVADLIDTALRTRSVKNPDGWRDFQILLRKINLPVSYITNLELKKFIKPRKTTTSRSTEGTTRRVKWSAYNGSSR